MTPTLRYENWGQLDYESAFARQKSCVQERLEGKREDTLIFVEHPAVYTLGSRKDAHQHLIWQEAELKKQGISLVRTNRGGDITYHGPGQLVVYPIVNLRPQCDLHAWLRFLEQVIIDVIGDYGLVGTRRERLTGIWIDTRKIAAIGVAVRQWITYHGFALNLNPDLAHFSGIVPCGITPAEGTVTSIAQEIDNAPSMEGLIETVRTHFESAYRQRQSSLSL